MNPATDLLRAVLALAFVLGLIWLLRGLVLKYGDKWGLPTTPLVPNKDRRLQVLESLALDSKTRLILIKRDQVQHLIVIGTAGAQIVETGIEGNGTP